MTIEDEEESKSSVKSEVSFKQAAIVAEEQKVAQPFHRRRQSKDVVIRKGRGVRVIPLTKLPWDGQCKGHSNANWDVKCWGCQ